MKCLHQHKSIDFVSVSTMFLLVPVFLLFLFLFFTFKYYVSDSDVIHNIRVILCTAEKLDL